MFEKRELRRIFGRLNNEELHNLYASLDITRVIKSRIRWACHVVRMTDEKIVQYFVWKA
jgi:hypothetical protein